MKHIACPVALHPDGAARRIAIYLHPTAGRALFKSAAPTAEDAPATAARILYTLSALETRAALPIGSSGDIKDNQLWHFALCRIVPPVRKEWKHLSNDGTVLHCTWMPLDVPTPDDFEAADVCALDWIRSIL